MIPTMDQNQPHGKPRLAVKLYHTDSSGFYIRGEKSSFIAGVCLGSLVAWYNKFSLINLEAKDSLQQLIATKPTRLECILSQKACNTLYTYQINDIDHLINFPLNGFNIIYSQTISHENLVTNLFSKKIFPNPFEMILLTTDKKHALAIFIKGNFLYLFDVISGFLMFSNNAFGISSIHRHLSLMEIKHPEIYGDEYHIYILPNDSSVNIS